MAINADTLRRQQQANVIGLSGEHKIGCACPHYLDRSSCPGPCPRAQRQRYATRDELRDLLAADMVKPPVIVIDGVHPLPAARAHAGRVLDALAAQGVDVDALVKITVEEVTNAAAR
jgi:hypothetical protein